MRIRKNMYYYCGEQMDEATGLYYLRARYMNPLTDGDIYAEGQL